MASIQSIRKLKLAQMDAARFKEFALCIREIEGALVSALSAVLLGMETAARELVKAFQPPHIFKVGDYATRDGSDVQRVTGVTDIFADFQCILAPHTGWCEAGEVEHNAMRRYRLLSKEEAEAMIKERWQGG